MKRESNKKTKKLMLSSNRIMTSLHVNRLTLKKQSQLFGNNCLFL
jgi:hypothetical protein